MMKLQKPLVCVASLALALLSTATIAQGRQRVANEGTIGDKWMLADGTKLTTAQYPPHLAAGARDVCIALGYKIGKDGGTSGFEVLKQWNSETGSNEPQQDFWKGFAQAGADALSQWKFKPRPDVRVPRETYTVATLSFMGSDQAKGGDIGSHCKIGDLAALLQKRESDFVFNKSRLRRDLDRIDRADESNAGLVVDSIRRTSSTNNNNNDNNNNKNSNN